MSIRLLRQNDSLEELTGLIHSAYKVLADQGFRYWATHQTAEDTQLRINQGECYVFENDMKIIGTIVVRYLDKTSPHPWYDKPEVTTFNQFAIDPKFHGKGIGSQLLTYVEDRALELGASELACDTAEGAKELITFYKKRDYRIVGEADWDQTNYKSVILSKALKTGTL